MHLLVQTKFTVQELSFSGKHDLSARTLVPVWVKGRPIAPLFPADLTPRCGGFRVPPGGGEKTIVLSKAISDHRHHHRGGQASLKARPAGTPRAAAGQQEQLQGRRVMKVQKTDDGNIKLSMEKYISYLMNQFDVKANGTTDCPMSPSYKMEVSTEPTDTDAMRDKPFLSL